MNCRIHRPGVGPQMARPATVKPVAAGSRWRPPVNRIAGSDNGRLPGYGPPRLPCGRQRLLVHGLVTRGHDFDGEACLHVLAARGRVDVPGTYYRPWQFAWLVDNDPRAAVDDKFG